jgi:3-methyladenine DNA glycosylase AlkD
MKAFELKNKLAANRNTAQAEILQRFFKTGKGEYAEGDIFLGIKVPVTRNISAKYTDLVFAEIKKLLHSKIHEERLAALLILVAKTKKSGNESLKEIYDFYLQNIKWINNWDLVDLSAEHIIGKYLWFNKSSVLYQLAKSENLWERRISIISTFYFIKHGNFQPTTEIAKILIKDEHDLIHKAVGWMLREIGKRDFDYENEFLKLNYKKMPRTMLRYAIEKFPENLRQDYLKNKI